MSKLKDLRGVDAFSSANDQYAKTVHILMNKYYNQYRSNFKWTGLNYRQEEFIMRKFWADGTVAGFKIPVAEEAGFAPWAMQSWDMYSLPETVMLINLHGSPLIPTTVQRVDKDCVIGYIQSNKKPLEMMVRWYVERIAQVEMVINTNLQLHKMPFLIPVDSNNKRKVEDIVRKILNDELVIFVEDEDPNLFNAVATAAPYIIDKLTNYKQTLESEVKTLLGVNNSNIAKVEQVQLSEVNSNNAEINNCQEDYMKNLNEFCDRMGKVCGIAMGVEFTGQLAVNMGEEHNFNGEQPGPKETEE